MVFVGKPARAAAALAQAGSQLLLLEGNPVALLPRLAQQLGAAGVAWNRDVEPLVRQRDRELATALKAIGVRVAADWDQLLVPPEQLKTGGGDPYRVYGPYWRSWEKQPKAKPVPAPSGLKALPEMDLSGLPVLDEVPVEPWEGLICAHAARVKQQPWSSWSSFRPAPWRTTAKAAICREMRAPQR